jgi:SPP1 gp7 family putative phage head morphogenesis protein
MSRTPKTLDEKKREQQEYWSKRMEQLEQSLHRPAEEVVHDLEGMYRQAERQIEADLSRWYSRFGNNNGVVSMAEARKLLTSGELKEFKWTLKEYREHAKDNGNGQWDKQLENASARWHISRLEALKYQMQNTVEVLAGGQQDALDSLLKNTYLNGYGQTAFTLQSGIGIGFDIAGLSDRAIQTLLNKPWTLDGRNFSERIWGSKQALIGELHKELTQNMLRGGNLEDVIAKLQQKFNTSYNNAARLVYTEHAYAVSVATGESYRATGVNHVVFIATLDERTSEICQSMDGTIIEMKDYQPGITVPPLHPYCRSTTSPYYADMVGIGERAARDEDGNTYYVPRDMTYPEWADTFLKDPDTGESGSKDGLTPVGAGAILSLADCKTTADVENLMKQQGWFHSATINGKVYDTNLTLSLEGCDLDIAKGVYEALDDIYKRFPELVGQLNSLSTANLSGSTYAQCSVGIGHGGVTLNKKWFSNVEKIAKSISRDIAAGFHPVGTDWKAVVSHEFGHAIDDLLSRTYCASGMLNRYKPKWVSADLRPKVMKACGLKVSDARKEVSGYATKDHFEWFAECFGEGMNSATPRKVATEFMKQLTEIIRRVVK